MKIEKLRKSHKKEIIIGVVLTVVIGGALTFRLTHSKYRYTQSIDLAEGVIHYKAPDFQIMAIKVSDDGENYNDSNVIPTGSYVINGEKTFCKGENGEEVKGKMYTNNSREHVLKNINKGDKCYLYFDKYTVGGYILANITVNSGKPDFSKAATTDEGVYATSDGMYNGTSYYYRGAVENNHVVFANKCWRIIRINGDNTIRLIYNGSVLTTGNNKCVGNGINANNIAVKNQPYAVDSGTYNKSYYVGWTWDATTNGGLQRPTITSGQETLTNEGTYSNARKQIESWYNTNIASKGFNDKVADGKFCNDRNVGEPFSSWSDYVTTWSVSGTKFAYAGVDRLWNKYTPTFDCNKEDVYTLKEGLITADELEFAGGKNAENTSYYLYNGQQYWTMSPFSSAAPYAAVFYVDSNGYLNGARVDGGNVDLRPVINLKSDVTFSSGNGTQNSPYVVN